MSRGRPPKWNPSSSLGADVWTEVAEFGSKGRSGIALTARRQLPWFDGAVERGLLATLEPEGSAQLEPWSSAGGAKPSSAARWVPKFASTLSKASTTFARFEPDVAAADPNASVAPSTHIRRTRTLDERQPAATSTKSG